MPRFWLQIKGLPGFSRPGGSRGEELRPYVCARAPRTAPNAGGADGNGEKKARAAEKNIDDAADCLQMLSSGGTN